MATTRSTPSTRKPTAHFDIAQAEKEFTNGLDDIEPFTVKMKSGDIVTFTDPRTKGWQVQASMYIEQNPFGALRELVSDEDYEKFVAEDFPSDLLRRLAKAYREHYGIEDAEGN